MTEDERRRIHEDERERYKAREGIKFQEGCGGCIGLVIAAVILLSLAQHC
jgi:hypothetical protein